MKRVLLFGGTTEGRELCERWASLPFLHVIVCVATSYGRELLSGVPENIEVLEGRKGSHEIAGLLSGEPDGDRYGKSGAGNGEAVCLYPGTG